MPPCGDCALVWSNGMTLPLAPAAAPAACSTAACAIWPRGGSAWCGRRASRKESCIILPGIWPNRWHLCSRLIVAQTGHSGSCASALSLMTCEQVLDRMPGLEKKQLTGAIRYFDGLTNDARLVLDTLRSAARNGAT